MTNIRHINRGDVSEGGCDLCKPRQSREDFDRGVIVSDQVVEGLDDYLDRVEDDEHASS